jgi:hypothetical protein
MPTTYALLSTYPPTQCGLAAFSAALFSHLRGPGDHVSVVGDLAPQLLWPAVARCYRDLAATVARSRDGAAA